ncbi:hypothetical protein QFC21_005004 [Naganishia friedmannii]|uniref:Uncharacterized protein n=1 Tax=Naganishia friedmannii TaxID=89922 RepID=A0ACC2VCM1_9TREE|nr:hypothetical protein QFC21_005004 [Naganishia friedmannii]
MSLALPQSRLRGQEPRLSSLLPGITCSSCDAQIPHSPSGQSQSSTQQSSSNYTLLSAAGPSLSAARNTTNLKIDLGAVSNYSGGKKQDGQRDTQPQQQSEHQSGGDAGMAGVGRRGFAGLDYDGAPSPTFHHPQKPQTPPHAAYSLPPTQNRNESQNHTSPYSVAAHAQAVHHTAHHHQTTTNNNTHTRNFSVNAGMTPLDTAGYSYTANAAASVSISISSPGSGPDGGLFTHSTRHHPPGSFNSSTNEHLFSPAAVPQTASSDSEIRPMTLFSHSKSSVYQSDKGSGDVRRRTSSTKGKGVSYPRPGVTPAEYTQRQQHLNRHTQAVSVNNVVSPNVKPTPDDAMQSYAQRQGAAAGTALAGQRGPLKVVNVTPRPESTVAFPKQDAGEVMPKYTAAAEAVGSMMASGVKKARGFMNETTVTWAGAKADDNKPDDERAESRNTEQVGQGQDGSRWNILRSAMKRGMSSSDKGEPPAVQVQITPMPFKQRESVEKIYEQASETASSSTTSGSASSAGKLEFFERYKKMAETTTTNPAVLTRTRSNTSPPISTSPIESQMMEQPIVGHREPRIRTRAEVMESLHEEEPAVLALSPIESRLEEAYMNDANPDFAWTRQREHKHVAGTERERIVTSRKKEAATKMHHSSPKDRNAGRLQQSTSISSLDSTQAEKIKMGETSLLTPSTSIDRLAEVLHARKESREDAFTQATTAWDGELDPIEGLVDQPPPAPSYDASFYSMLSPNASRAISEQFYRSQRESSASSLLAPSDSVSTPGLGGDKFKVDHSIVTPIREKAKPGTRVCQKCGQNLKGKRFIDRDGIMLCESDWKEMFLPKCRRCEKPIETSAVSSRDGQLKGKWHRACFSCYKCSQEFEGESFYVHDDKPYCQLHYHEADGSLCASTQCGKPIEGPCLLTANNQRYHPGHLACDYGDAHRPCRDPMMDYYEIGTLKVCERHKDAALTDTIKRSRKGRSDDMTAKAEKRRTRLIEA